MLRLLFTVSYLYYLGTYTIFTPQYIFSRHVKRKKITLVQYTNKIFLIILFYLKSIYINIKINNVPIVSANKNELNKRKFLGKKYVKLPFY